jgi:hypothetical protein
MFKETILIALMAIVSAYNSPSRLIPSPLRMSENADMFGGDKAEETKVGLKTEDYKVNSEDRAKFQMKAAARLRREAEEMEIALRDEARAKGIPKEVIDKLVPIRSSTPAIKNLEIGGGSGVEENGSVMNKIGLIKMPIGDVRKKLGYLNSGDAVRFSSELDRVKSKGSINIWNSEGINGRGYDVNNYQLKTKTGIAPVDLRLDDVGFEYQKVFFIALALGSVLGLASSQIGGQIGFLMGYASALFPISLVGIGSISPGLIGDVLKAIEYTYNAEARDRRVKNNAAKFLTGYASGLPVSKFKSSGVSSSVEFFQVQPSQMDTMKGKKITQDNIARASMMAVAGSVAECMEFGVASGSSPGDVNTLYELMNAVQPTMEPERVQNHIGWSVVGAYQILSKYEDEYKRLCEAFENKEALEDCIAIIEGKP